MRICYSLDNYDRASGGAALAARGLAHHLADLGHEVSILQPGRKSDYSDGAIQVHGRNLRRPYLYRQHDRDTLGWNRQWRHTVDDYLEQNPTDLLITQNRLLSSSIDAAVARNIPTVIWAHAFRLFCPDKFFRRDPLQQCQGNCTECLGGMFREAVKDNQRAYQHGLQQANLIMANSQYMAKVIKHLTDRDAPVVYPTFDLDDWRQPGAVQRDHVLFIKPQEGKGFSIFLDIAKALPDKTFVVAGKTSRSARKALQPLANVSTIEWSNEMRQVYARTQALLGPSISPEPFGRVFVEAASAGVPSITSNQGGIPEAVGSGGILIDNIYDLDAWVNALRSLDDPEVSGAFANRARAHACQFDSKTIGRALRDSVLAATGLDLHVGSQRN